MKITESIRRTAQAAKLLAQARSPQDFSRRANYLMDRSQLEHRQTQNQELRAENKLMRKQVRHLDRLVEGGRGEKIAQELEACDPGLAKLFREGVLQEAASLHVEKPELIARNEYQIGVHERAVARLQRRVDESGFEPRPAAPKGISLSGEGPSAPMLQ